MTPQIKNIFSLRSREWLNKYYSSPAAFYNSVTSNLDMLATVAVKEREELEKAKNRDKLFEEYHAFVNEHFTKNGHVPTIIYLPPKDKKFKLDNTIMKLTSVSQYEVIYSNYKRKVEIGKKQLSSLLNLLRNRFYKTFLCYRFAPIRRPSFGGNQKDARIRGVALGNAQSTLGKYSSSSHIARNDSSRRRT